MDALEQVIVARSLATQCETNLIVVDSNLLHKLACLFNLEELQYRGESCAQAHTDNGVHREVCKQRYLLCRGLEMSLEKACSFSPSLFLHVCMHLWSEKKK